MTSDKQTPTINGLRLVTPEEAGYSNTDSDGNEISAIIESNGKPINYITDRDRSAVYIARLIPLPKPRTIRPFKRGEVKWEWKFRHKDSGADFAVTYLADKGIGLNSNYVEYENLKANYHKLTYDADGKEVLSAAGVESE